MGLGFRKPDEDDDDPYEIDKETLMELESEFTDQSAISKAVYDMKIPVMNDGYIPFGIALFFTYKRVHGNFKKMHNEREEEMHELITRKNKKIEIKNIVKILKKELKKVNRSPFLPPLIHKEPPQIAVQISTDFELVVSFLYHFVSCSVSFVDLELIQKHRKKAQ